MADKIIIEIRYPNYLDFYFKGNRFISHLGELRDPFDMTEILINNNIYKNIILIYGKQPKDSIYFGVGVGILKFGFQSGEQWTLLK